MLKSMSYKFVSKLIDYRQHVNVTGALSKWGSKVELCTFTVYSEGDLSRYFMHLFNKCGNWKHLELFLVQKVVCHLLDKKTDADI